MKTHVINEAASPVTDNLVDVWTMWCGEQCIVFDDASLAPDGFDFYHEDAAHLADCDACIANHFAAEVAKIAEASP